MQNGALSDDIYGQSIYGATGKYAEHGISGGSYKTLRRKMEMNILNNPACLYRPLGYECEDTAKRNSGSVRGVRQQ